jgi:transcription initiation factor TFIIIB Brf1 subunit/transcription initiation factor TFIIB
MITQCPKCHYARQAWDNKNHPEICPSCGIVYRKWLANQAELATHQAISSGVKPTPSDSQIAHKPTENSAQSIQKPKRPRTILSNWLSRVYHE